MNDDRGFDFDGAGGQLPRCALIFGEGRSGTSWLAQALNTCEHASCKHEPFLGEKHAEYNESCQGFEVEE